MRFLACVFAAACALGQPRIQNAQLEQRDARGGLAAQFDAAVSAQQSPAWIGWAVPAVANHPNCCFQSSDGWASRGCGLEPSAEAPRFAGNAAGPVKLEGSRTVHVLFRVETAAAGKIRSFSEDCELDAGGLRVIWLNNVNPAESTALLDRWVSRPAVGRDEERLRDAAVSAIALHRDPAADALLEKYTSPGQPEAVRRKTAFWLGATRGRRGYELLTRMVRSDPSEKVRDSAVHGLSVSKEPGALDSLIETAKKDENARVRGQALFWLAQKAGRNATATIQGAIENDPNTEVKKKAVFALSQLPKEEGVPLLMQVARTNRNPEVRKQAMFWLGQSKDPKAVAFFEELLKK